MTWMEAIRWAMACLLGIASIYVAVLNWFALVRRVTRSSGPTWIPLIGGLLGVAAMLLEPTGVAGSFWWIPLILDAGSVPGFVVVGVYLVSRRWGGGSFT